MTGVMTMKVRVFLGDVEVYELIPLVRELLVRNRQVYVSGEELRRFVRHGGYEVAKEFGRLFASQDVLAEVARDYSASIGL